MRMSSFLALVGVVALAGVGTADAGVGSSVTLVWTTPGDDGAFGTPSQYDLRFSDRPINATNFAAATRVAFVPRPSEAGTLQSCTVAGLTQGIPYYFALKTADEKGNWSQISNIAYFDGRTVGFEAAASLPMSFSSPWPNPAVTSTRFSFTLPERSGVQVDVFDAQGRRVRSLLDGDQNPGYHELAWDLSDAAGRPVGGGVYFVTVESRGRRFQKRMIVAR